MESLVQRYEQRPVHSIQHVTEPLSSSDLADLCDCTDLAIEDGGGFGWVDLPDRDTLELYWQGIIAMPSRLLFLARQDDVICGSAQLILPPKHNQAQSFSATLQSLFITPWARHYGLATELLQYIEKTALEKEIEVLNLDVRETQTLAIKLYENAGYVKIGEHPYYARIEGKTLKGIYYYKTLKSQEAPL